MIAMAEIALKDRGDVAAGEWLEHGRIAYHIRRRLMPAECALANNLTVCDVRGTEAGRKRLESLFASQPKLRAIAQQIGETAE